MLSGTERLSLKMLRADKMALRRLATAEGEPVSVVVRRILREELKRRGLLQAAGDALTARQRDAAQVQGERGA